MTATEIGILAVAEQTKQIWAIEVNGGDLLAPIDDDGVACFMAFPTHSDAGIALESQIRKGFVQEDDNPRVVRVK